MGRRVREVAAAVLAAACIACLGPASPEPEPRLEPVETPSPTAQALVELINVERTRAGVAALAADAALMRAAQLQAEQMTAAGRMAHTLPEARYPTMEERLAAAGYGWSTAGENLAFGQPSAAAVVAGWMQSPGHRANILNAAFTEIGAAHMADASGRVYYVQVFGRPR